MTDSRTTTHAQAGDTVLTFRREFDASAELVFRCHTEQDLFVRWMGPRGTSCTVDRFEASTGGGFHYTIGAGGGAGYTFFGSYHEVTPGRIVHTWEFEGDPGRPTLETLRFVPLADGRSALEGTSVYTSIAHCAEMLDFDESGEGMDENFERLDEVLRELA